MRVSRDIGVADAPRRTCDDPKCPFHGNISVRGKVLEARVVSDKMKGTVTVQREAMALNPKYKRYERKRTRIAAHNPPCIDAKEGDTVRVGECRPLAKTVSFVVLEKMTDQESD